MRTAGKTELYCMVKQIYLRRKMNVFYEDSIVIV